MSTHTDPRFALADPGVQRGLADRLPANHGVAAGTAVHTGSNQDHAEKIVGQLVNNYLHCSTTVSGIFLCW